MPLEGKFVEVHSLSPDTSFNGATGYCASLLINGEYEVLTFEGDLVFVGESNIREIEPASGTKGGFDVFWLARPDEERLPDVLAAKVATAVQKKGYCVIQTAQDRSLRQEAILASESQCNFGALTAELTEGYLGLNGFSKIAWLDGSHPQQLDPYDETFSKVGTSLGAFAPSYLDWDLSSRSYSMVRKALQEDDVTPEQLSINDLEQGVLDDYNEFCRTSRLLMMYVVDDAGEITINIGPSDTTIPLSPNKLIVVRADASYTYKPSSTQSMVMQCWLLGDSAIAAYEQAVEYLEDPNNPGNLSNQYARMGPQTNMISLMIRTPGSVDGDIRMFTCMTVAACDTVTNIASQARFDLAEAPMGDKGEVGKMYVHHGAYKERDFAMDFDNVFFGFSEDEMVCASKENSVYFETAYTALNKAGHTKKSLQGHDIGLYCGTNGSCGDIGDMFGRALYHDKTQYVTTGINPGFMMARFARFLNSIGLSMVVDTACSASLVAIALPDKDFKLNRRDDKCEALSGGVNVMTGWQPYFFFCTIGALSAKGRSFTFDHNVDGYCRGEGCCQSVLRRSDNQTWKTDVALTVGTVLGSTVGSDGKSASLTAPSGPAQQAMMRHSMAMAGITIHECPGNECHGTGTALGDPIEMGSVKSLWKTSDTPVGVTSRKTYFGHTEANAGIAGICGCLAMLNLQMSIPNIHLRECSGLLDLQGFMTQFWTEATQFQIPNAYVGVNSFGIGGTNARADLWSGRGQATNESQKTIAVEVLSIIAAAQQEVARPLDDKEPERLHISDRVYVVGTWDGGKVPLEMSPEREDTYTAVVQLGEEYCEQFHIMVGPQGLEEKARPALSQEFKLSQFGTPDAKLEDLTTLRLDTEDGDPEESVVDMIFNMMGSVEFGLLVDDDFLAQTTTKFAESFLEQEEQSPEAGMTFLPVGDHIIYQQKNPPAKAETVQTDQDEDQDEPQSVERTEEEHTTGLAALKGEFLKQSSKQMSLQDKVEDADVESPVEMQSEATGNDAVAKQDVPQEKMVDEASFLDDLTAFNPDTQPLNIAVTLLDISHFANHPYDDEDVRADFTMLAEVVKGLEFDVGTMEVEDDAEIIDAITKVDRIDLDLPVFPASRRKLRYDTRDKSVVPANGKELRFIYPSETASSSSSRVFGPDVLRRDEGWLIDGKGSTNAFYRITLNLTDRRSLVWSPLDEPPSNFPAVPFAHSYYMIGPSTKGRLRELMPSSGAGSYELSLTLNEAGKEEFRVVRDKDMRQAVYPAEKPGILLGPDAGSGTWLVEGKPGEHVKLVLLAMRGKITFSVTMSDSSVKFWQS